MHGQSTVTTYLFTDIEGSTRLWEQEPERMRPALARHDALTREAVEANRGRIVKTTGDGFHAVFDDPLDALAATLQLQLQLANSEKTNGVTLRVRSALHAGVDERRDNDFYGPVVNRAARIMNAAHGGQMLVSQTVAALIRDRLPQDVALRDLGRVRLRDLTGAEPVYQVLHSKLRQNFPALRSLEATPNNLPQQVTSFIGRERELHEVSKLLPTTRLLTLLGMGGLGKTRLSLQLAAEVLDDFPDGVWFVELAPLADEHLVAQAVASVLAVKEMAGRPVVDALVQYFSTRRLLLILDNCEHLVRACAELSNRVLQATPHVRIITSSREPLRISGETTYPVSPLSVPDPTSKEALATLTQFPAASLFVERAAAVQPSFRATAENRAAIAQICYRLDGIPLAIELAAARIRVLSPDAIAERLSDRYKLLTQGDKSSLPRQQTLRALIDWSYELLSIKERIFFQRLAVFAGGWTLEAAEAICPGDPIAPDEILDLLAMLVDKSLLVLDAERARYRFLDTIRQYAQEKLSGSGEAAELRTRHLDFYLALAERARPELSGPRQGEWLALLDLDRENLSTAHSWCSYSDQGADKGLRLVYGVRIYWFSRGMLAVGLRSTLDALARTSATSRSSARGRALFHAGQFGLFMGKHEEAQRYLEESLAIARESGDKGRIAAVLPPLGTALLGQGDLEGARRHLEEGVAVARDLGNKPGIASALNSLAQLHRMQGALETAKTLYDQVVALARDIEDQYNVAVGMLNLAMVAVGRKREDDARQLLLDVLLIAEQIGSSPVGQGAIEVCAGFAATVKAWQVCATFYGAAEAQVQRTGLHRDPADDAFLLPLIDEARLVLGAETFAREESIGRSLSYQEAIGRVRAWLGTRVH